MSASIATTTGSSRNVAAAGRARLTALKDFGDRFGPVMVKELRQGLRARRFVGPFLLIQILAVFAVLTEAALAGFGAGMGSGVVQAGSSLLMQVIGLMLGVFMPLTGFAALQPELDRGRNVELLLLANLSRGQIVVGKWLVMSLLAGLMLVSLLPYLLARHFIGGVDLVWSLSFVGGTCLLNLTMNAAVIGASGFNHVIARLVVLGITVGSYSITSMVVMMPTMMSPASGLFAKNPLLSMALIGLLSLIVAALYCAYGLQMGRDKLRLFENLLDPPASGLLIAMLIFTPVMVGVSTVAGIFAAPVVCLVLMLAVLAVDRGAGKKSDRPYAQP